MTDSIKFKIRNGLVHEISGRSLFEKMEGNQFFQIVNNEIFGNALFINGVPQLSELDEKLYHKVQVKSLASGVYQGENVLILGGGDFGLVSELRDEPAREIHVVDISKNMIEITEKFFPELFKSYENITLHTQDCFEYLESARERACGVIFADLSGTTREEDKLFDSAWLKLIQKKLKENGVFVTYLDNEVFYPEMYEKKFDHLKKIFSYVQEKRAYIPLFGYEVPFVFCSAKPLELKEVDTSIKVPSLNPGAKTWEKLYK